MPWPVTETLKIWWEERTRKIRSTPGGGDALGRPFSNFLFRSLIVEFPLPTTPPIISLATYPICKYNHGSLAEFANLFGQEDGRLTRQTPAESHEPST